MQSRLQFTGLGLALLSVLLLVPIGLEVYRVVELAPRLLYSRDWVAHTIEVMNTVEALQRTAEDAERSQRGFLLTGDAAYLGPYHRAAGEAPALLARFKRLTVDNREQQQRAAQLESAVSGVFAGLEDWLQAYRRGGGAAATAWARQHAWMENMQAMDSLAQNAADAENALLEERLAGLAEEERRSGAAVLTAVAIALVIIAIGLVIGRTAYRRYRKSEQGLAASEERFRLLVEGVTDYAIYLLDPAGKVSSWNAGAERIKGYRADEIVGRPFSVFFPEEDQLGGAPVRALEIAAHEGKYEAEAWQVRKDGRRFFASVTINPLRDATGRLVGYVKITRDITEPTLQRRALDEARNALAQSQKMEVLGQLTGGIAHDFNNFLHVIRNAVEAIQRRTRGGDPDVARFLDLAHRNADRAAALTQRLLAFSRRQPLVPKAVDANKLVRGMAELLRQSLGEGILVETVLGGGVWRCSADPNQLETAILNLAVNARDAMQDGGKLTVETANIYLDENYAGAQKELKAGQYVMIAVSDTGTGMDKEVIAQAFDPFFTTKPVGQGTGLGLSQVYGFIKQSGGHVNIYSETGSGTTVKLYLPRLTAQEAEEHGVDMPSSPPSHGGATILVVEDEDDVRQFSVETLSELGYRVLQAGDADAALDVLERESDIGLLFTDVGLPGSRNGRQLADEVQARRPGMKVLFATAYTRNAVIHHGRLDAGVEMIMKPFAQSELAEKVRRVLSGS